VAAKPFHFLAGIGLADRPLELSLHTLEQGEIGTLTPGPALPGNKSKFTMPWNRTFPVR
jgi:hypothetical protein